jgi:hypothetical protein
VDRRWVSDTNSDANSDIKIDTNPNGNINASAVPNIDTNSNANIDANAVSRTQFIHSQSNKRQRRLGFHRHSDIKCACTLRRRSDQSGQQQHKRSNRTCEHHRACRCYISELQRDDEQGLAANIGRDLGNV